MTTAYTPGPWQVDQLTNSLGTIETPDGIAIGQAFQVRPHRDDVHSLERKANARLMASAPCLLAALEAALSVIGDYLEYDHDGDPWKEDARLMGEMEINDYQRDGRLESARAAIAKATGVEP